MGLNNKAFLIKEDKEISIKVRYRFNKDKYLILYFIFGWILEIIYQLLVIGKRVEKKQRKKEVTSLLKTGWRPKTSYDLYLISREFRIPKKLLWELEISLNRENNQINP